MKVRDQGDTHISMVTFSHVNTLTVRSEESAGSDFFLQKTKIKVVHHCNKTHWGNPVFLTATLVHRADAAVSFGQSRYN